MSRCKGCDSILSNLELYYKDSITREHDSLCYKCRSKSFDITEQHEYVHGLETESFVSSIVREGYLRVAHMLEPTIYQEEETQPFNKEVK